MPEKSEKSSVKSVKLPVPVYDRLAGAARDLRIDPARFLELAMRRMPEVRLAVHAELLDQVTAEYSAARRKASPSASARPRPEAPAETSAAPAGTPSPASAGVTAERKARPASGSPSASAGALSRPRPEAPAETSAAPAGASPRPLAAIAPAKKDGAE